jgi:peptide/nickel transport system permease protein
MLRYVVRRLLAMVPLMFFITSLAFILGEYGAGDLAAYLVFQTGGGRIDTEAYMKMRVLLGLDDPIHVRYVRWVWNALHGDLGKSWITVGQPSVTYLLGKALPVSLQMGVGALVIVVVLGIPLGIIAAAFHNRFLDYLIIGTATIFSSIPTFVLAPIAMIILVAQFRLLPSVGLGWHGIFSKEAILPLLVLAIGPVRGIARYTRQSVLEVLSQEYVRAARARGLAEYLIITKHVVKNAMLPVITVLGMTASGLVAGSIFIEQIFNIRGLGFLASDAIRGGDIQTSTGVLICSATIVMSGNLLVDLSYGLLDPRVRLSER